MTTHLLQQHYQASQQHQANYQQYMRDQRTENQKLIQASQSERLASASNPSYYAVRSEVINSFCKDAIACGCLCLNVIGTGLGISLIGVGIADLAKHEYGDGGTLLGIGIGMTAITCCIWVRIMTR